MYTPFSEALVFLINTIFDLFLFILIIRLLLVWVGAEWGNPLVQFVVKFTDFIVKPVRKLIPNFRRLETATIIIILILELCKYALILLLTYSQINHPLGLIILALADIIRLVIQTFFYAIIIQVVLSWIQPYSPFSFTLQRITAPVMRPFQQVIPPIGGFDISPIAALILLQVLNILIVTPLFNLGLRVALG